MLDINKIYNMDCLEGMKLISDKSIDCIICDLPYGTTACKWDNIIPFEPLWEQYERIVKDNGAVVLFSSQPFTSFLVMSNPKLFKYEFIWDREVTGHPLNAKKQPLRRHENICVFYKKQCTYNPQKEYIGTERAKDVIKKSRKEGKVIKDGATNTYTSISRSEAQLREEDFAYKYPSDIIVFNNRKKECNSINRLHPTQKPVDLIEYLIKTYTNEGELILDNCMGSGTTAIAAMNTNRNYIGFELDEHYYNVAMNRIKEHGERICKEVL